MNKSKKKAEIPNGEKMKLKKVKPLRFLDEKRKTAPIPTATTATATPRSIWFSEDCKKSMTWMMSEVMRKIGRGDKVVYKEENGEVME